jgi:segregation and condensation protein B
MTGSREIIKSALESMLYVWGRPLAAKDAGRVFGLSEQETVELFLQLQAEYEKRDSGIRIRRIRNDFQFITAPENAEFIRRLCTPVKEKRLTQASLEVLAIIAYLQPVTRGRIDQIRGIKCDRVVDGLVEKGLVESRGRSDGVGRPILYGTTDAFLAYMGLESLDELPEISEEGILREEAADGAAQDGELQDGADAADNVKENDQPAYQAEGESPENDQPEAQAGEKSPESDLPENQASESQSEQS